MKKVLGAMSKFIFSIFCIAVLALLMTLTYGALQKLFPGNFTNQMWGLVMFDIAAMCWAVAFVFQSKSTMQYAAAGLGFVVAFLGTLGMVAAEVMLSGQNLAQIDTTQIGQWMVYGFIVVTAIHAALVYAHHAGAPEIHEQINVGVARGEIVTEAITQATKVLDEQRQNLAYTIRNDIVAKAKRDLGLIEADPRMPIIPAEPQTYEQVIPHPVPPKEKPQSFFDRVRGLWSRGADQAPITMEQAAMTSDAEMAWKDMPDGTRRRHWCKVCRDQGLPWLTAEPCEHVRTAKEFRKIPDEVVENTLKALESEEMATVPTSRPLSYHPRHTDSHQQPE